MLLQMMRAGMQIEKPQFPHGYILGAAWKIVFQKKIFEQRSCGAHFHSFVPKDFGDLLMSRSLA